MWLCVPPIAISGIFLVRAMPEMYCRAFGIWDEVCAIFGAKNAMHQVGRQGVHGFEVNKAG